MTSYPTPAESFKVADRAFITVAKMTEQYRDRESFTINELMEYATRYNLLPSRPSSLRQHLYEHCVANRAASTGRYRMLYELPNQHRRLLRRDDVCHPSRTGKMFPKLDEVPLEYKEVVKWAQARYEQTPEQPHFIDLLLAMQGTFKYTREGQSVDDYVRELRADWDE